MTAHTTWVKDRNLRPTMQALAFVCGYDFVPSDWVVIEHGVKGVDETQGIWFDYPLLGDFRIDTSTSLETGSANYSLKVASERDISIQIEMVEFFAQCFLISDL